MLEINIDKRYAIEAITSSLPENMKIIAKRNLKENEKSNSLMIRLDDENYISFHHVGLTIHNYGITTICNITSNPLSKIHVCKDYKNHINEEAMNEDINRIQKFIIENNLSGSLNIY